MTEKKIRKYVIATLTNPTMYLQSLHFGKYAFLDIEGATKFITKGMANKDFLWIRRLYTSLLGLAIVAGVAMMGLVPLLPYIVKVWLGDGYVIKTGYTILFVIYSAFAIWNSVNSTIANGLGVLKAQAIFLTFGAILNIPLSYILAVATNSWIGIVCANIISYIPVCVIQPVYLWRFLKTQNNMGKDVV